MKKFLIIGMIIWSLLGCCGCSRGSPIKVSPSFNFSAQLQVIADNQDFTCTFSRMAPGIASCQTGLISFYWEEDGFRVSSADLSVQYPACTLPESSPIRLLQELLDAADEQELEKVSESEWKGNCNKTVFLVEFEKETGQVAKIEVPSHSWSFVFSEVTAL